MSLRPPPVSASFDVGGMPSREWVAWIQDAHRYIASYRGYNTTANRPTNGMVAGDWFFDTTLEKPVWWNGTAWQLAVYAGTSANSTVSVTSSDASTVTGTPTTGGDGFANATEFNTAITAINSIKTLANECKADINSLVTDLNSLKTVLRTAGIIG